jgi:Ni,Fe-hydrogenase I large subunit
MFNISKITIISYRNIFLLSSLKIINALNITHRTKKNYIRNMLHIIYKLKLEQFYHYIVLAFVNDLKHKK